MGVIITLPVLLLFWVICAVIAFVLFTSAKTRRGAIRRKLAILVVVLAVLTPTWDVLLGKYYMAYVCKYHAGFRVYGHAEAVESVLLTGNLFRPVESMVATPKHPNGYRYIETVGYYSSRQLRRLPGKVRVYWSEERQDLAELSVDGFQSRHAIGWSSSQTQIQKILGVQQIDIKVQALSPAKLLAEHAGYRWRGGWFWNMSVDSAAGPISECPDTRPYDDIEFIKTKILVSTSRG